MEKNIINRKELFDIMKYKLPHQYLLLNRYSNEY